MMDTWHYMYLSKLIELYYTHTHTYTMSERRFIHFKIKTINPINRLKKSHTIVSIENENAVIKSLKKFGIEGNFFSLRMVIYKNLQLTSYLIVKD